jgi:hypothetical protein
MECGSTAAFVVSEPTLRETMERARGDGVQHPVVADKGPRDLADQSADQSHETRVEALLQQLVFSQERTAKSVRTMTWLIWMFGMGLFLTLFFGLNAVNDTLGKL